MSVYKKIQDGCRFHGNGTGHDLENYVFGITLSQILTRAKVVRVAPLTKIFIFKALVYSHTQP